VHFSQPTENECLRTGVRLPQRSLHRVGWPGAAGACWAPQPSDGASRRATRFLRHMITIRRSRSVPRTFLAMRTEQQNHGLAAWFLSLLYCREQARECLVAMSSLLLSGETSKGSRSAGRTDLPENVPPDVLPQVLVDAAITRMSTVSVCCP
jgi:hypothetical protein